MSEVVTLYVGRHLCLQRRETWEYAERRRVSGVVTIVPVTESGELLIVEQMRVPVGASVLEFPAGLAGDVSGLETEELIAAAQRELLEETGYEATEWQLLPTCPTSAGLTSELVTFFRASGLKKVSDSLGDGNEEITLHTVPIAGVDAWLTERIGQGAFVATTVYAGLYLAKVRDSGK